jgi:hypothetical protein
VLGAGEDDAEEEEEDDDGAGASASEAAGVVPVAGAASCAPGPLVGSGVAAPEGAWLAAGLWRALARWRAVDLVDVLRGAAALDATGTAGSVVTAAALSAAKRVTARPLPCASSVDATLSSGARMPGQPWKATPVESNASRIPPAAMMEPEAPAAAAKARKKRIRVPHRPAPNDP